MPAACMCRCAVPTLQGTRKYKRQQKIRYIQIDFACQQKCRAEACCLHVQMCYMVLRLKLDSLGTCPGDEARTRALGGVFPGCSHIPCISLHPPNIAQLAHSLIDVLLASIHIAPQLVHSPLCCLRLLLVDGQLLLSTLHLDVDVLHLQAMRERHHWLHVEPSCMSGCRHKDHLARARHHAGSNVTHGFCQLPRGHHCAAGLCSPAGCLQAKHKQHIVSQGLGTCTQARACMAMVRMLACQ